MNPLTGRFWSMDSYEGAPTDPVSLHKYLYSGSDPSNNVDPSGNLSLAEVSVTAAIGFVLSASYVNAPAPGDRIYPGDPAGVDLIINIVGGGALDALIVKPLASVVGAAVKYSTRRVGQYIIPRVEPIPIQGVAKLPEYVQKSFGGVFAPRTTAGKTILYRVEGGESINFGGFYSTEKPFNALRC